MKKVRLLGYLIILLSGFAFLQCTSDEPIYVAGEDGVDGVDGADGVDGSAAACIACHSDSHRLPIIDSYQLSGHFNEHVMFNGDDLSAFANRTDCASCHTSDGFKDYVDGYPIAEGTGSSDPSYPGTQTVTCTTCHSNHSTFDFENDGPDYALRLTMPVTLLYDNTTTIDFEGTSNLCIGCHQTRDSYPIPADDGSGMVTITSQRYGPHHGPQSPFLEGILAANIPGSEGYPGIGANGDNTHRTGASCVSCHMGETTDTTDGAHSMAPTENACITCHTSGVPAEVDGFASDLETLKGILLGLNYINDGGSVLGPDGNNASSTNPLVIPVEHAQAIWNYKVLIEDNSDGIHNPKYAKALLSNTIEAMQN